MSLENGDQAVNSDCNPDMSNYLVFGYAKKTLIHKRSMTGLKKLHLPVEAQKSGTCQ
jgi:hypothetical protein